VATCYRHPDRPTGVACVRCGRPICPECMIPASVGFQCPDDVRAGGREGRGVRPGTGARVAARRWGPVTLGLIAVNVAAFVVTAISAMTVGNSPLDNYASPLFRELSQIPFLVADGEVWRLLTAAFLHIGAVHLALNMLALLLFGSELERRLGRPRYLALYLLAALGGSAAVQLFGAPNTEAAGASGAIYGLFGALGVLMLIGREDLRGLVTLLVINLGFSVLYPGISLQAHVGGLVTGAVVALVLWSTRRRPAVQVAALVVLALAVVVPALVVPLGTLSIG
jgi:membrane associated rhomboid family serine protease